MNTEPTRKRRTQAEIQQLASEFLSSGLRRSEFCRQHGLSFGTLQRYLNQQQAPEPNAIVPASRLLPVQLTSLRASSTVGSGLAVALANGTKIEVARGFDIATLERLLSVLERG